MPLIWWEARWTSRGFHWQTSRLTFPECQKRSLWLLQWKLQVNLIVLVPTHKCVQKLLFLSLRNYFSFILWLFLSCVFTNKKQWDGRCEEQVGEQFMGQKADCAEKKSFSQWFWQVQGHAGKDQGVLQPYAFSHVICSLHFGPLILKKMYQVNLSHHNQSVHRKIL